MRLDRRALMAGGIAMLGARAFAASRDGAGYDRAGYDYGIAPQAIADGLWIVRGADAPILRDNGGAIANLAILATDAGTVLIDCGPSLRYGKALKAAAFRLTGRPVTRIFLTHFHPDHCFAAAAFPDALVSATPEMVRGLTVSGPGFSDGMYRLLDDWMRGTELPSPRGDVGAGPLMIGGRTLRMLPLSGHSAADLAIFDEATGTVFAGDLVFHDRAPATPEADLSAWRTSLETLKQLGHRTLLPGHGPYDPSAHRAIDQTRDWINWLEISLRDAVASGRDMVEAGAMPIPPRFARMQAARYELQRSVSHFYPRIEAELFARIDRGEG
ncbi:quinoprotein relay system zinc metallohydrolase 1 [Sphingomonas sp. 37zxx]|uniref:quinoprotein relay system zinc metallohydrolase 1 n=1 Tax=Sphingomonas sp. 37zxx TaxID=1550073 RepID=UPI00053BEC50|nr:quinoprotein relay system zinc metallohydrolase 1 [Sphingomonas sp. 37zxx]